MWIWLWIILGIFCWLAGFFRAGFSEDDGSLISKAFVRPPLAIYFLCGQPKASNIPRGVVALRSLMAQLQGILFVIYGVATNFMPIKNLGTQVIVLSLTGFTVLWFCWLLYKRYPYLDSNSRI